MIKHRTALLLGLTLLLVAQIPTQAQILNKLKKKAEEKLLGKDKEEENKQNNPSTPNNPSNSGTVQGKKLVPPNVNNHLDNASAAIKTTNPNRYSTTRFELKQAIMGIELEIGHEILKSMPTSVNGLNYQPDNDEVASTGIGFAGFGVSRFYENNNKSLKAGILNNAAMIVSYNALLGSSVGYNSNQSGHKVVTVQGNRSVLEFDGSNTYKLVVPFGQSSFFYGEFENFSDENEVLNAVNNFKISDYMTLLDEK